MIVKCPCHRLQGTRFALKKRSGGIWRTPFATVITVAAAGDRSSVSRPGDFKTT